MSDSPAWPAACVGAVALIVTLLVRVATCAASLESRKHRPPAIFDLVDGQSF